MIITLNQMGRYNVNVIQVSPGDVTNKMRSMRTGGVMEVMPGWDAGGVALEYNPNSSSCSLSRGGEITLDLERANYLKLDDSGTISMDGTTRANNQLTPEALALMCYHDYPELDKFYEQHMLGGGSLAYLFGALNMGAISEMEPDSMMNDMARFGAFSKGAGGFELLIQTGDVFEWTTFKGYDLGDWDTDQILFAERYLMTPGYGLQIMNCGAVCTQGATENLKGFLEICLGDIDQTFVKSGWTARHYPTFQTVGGVTDIDVELTSLLCQSVCQIMDITPTHSLEVGIRDIFNKTSKGLVRFQGDKCAEEPRGK
jgi:hypothetical protein